MGRIAEALKKAEAEQKEKGALTETLCLEPVAIEQQEEFSEAVASLAETPRLVEPGGGLSPDLVPYYDRTALITEQYRSLRTRILSQNPGNDHRILAITSSLPREGKSVTTLNMGFVLAEVQHLRVLMVDGDFRRSSLASMLCLENVPGLTDVIRGETALEDAIQPTHAPDLFFLPAGRTKGANAAELLSSQSAVDVFRRLHAEYHYSLVDTPPACTVTDVGVIGQMCSGALMIVRMHKIMEPVARRAVRLLQANNIPIIGCLLAGHNERGPRYGYNYNCYYYHRYNNSEKRSHR